MQFYVVTYHFTSNPTGSEYVYVDRVPIDLQLNISTNFTERRTYSGIHNISQFDMSFRLSGQCAENYYGPRCAILLWGGRSVHLWQWRQHSVCESRGWPTEQLCHTRYDWYFYYSTVHGQVLLAVKFKFAMKNSWKGQLMERTERKKV